MKTVHDRRGVDQIAGTYATRHVIDDVTHRHLAVSSSQLVHHLHVRYAVRVVQEVRDTRGY